MSRFHRILRTSTLALLPTGGRHQVARAVVQNAVSVLLCACVWLLLARALPAEAGGQVNNCSNDLQFTTALGGGGPVTFNCGSATITLASTKLITQNTTIDGANLITLSGGGLRRLFVV